MIPSITRPGRAIGGLLAVLAVAVAACGGGSTASTAPTTGSNSTDSGASGGGGGVGGGALTGAAARLSDINSYKFSMTMIGGDLATQLSGFSGATLSATAPIKMSGTIIVKPNKAADIMMGAFHMIETGGSDYMDVSGTGTFISTPMTGPGLADSFAPASMFSTLITGSTVSGFNKVGTEPKNGVSADHYQGSQAELAALGPESGVTGATWTADVWIATDGGYPVSLAIVGTTNKVIVYEVLFDIINVNDPANAVTAPSA
jgi:hypothetical protein